MRAGGFTIQQALTPDAASIIKQAVTLARRRGHAQVTPLHVANTMLSASTGLLRTACLQSNSHPLQCRALELCFNVALNRLPASSSSPMLGTHSQHPSISNALVAAFKRAQAHQRRGSIENQQQPLLAVKIELEQLIISILDDPSVSRVMREAGFSSTLVKSNVEQAVSLELCAQNPPPSNNKSKENNLLMDGSKGGKLRASSQARNEDVMSVIENLSNKKKRSFVIVGECLASIEGVIGRVMEKIDVGDVPEALRDLKFMNLPLFSFGHLSRREVEEKLEELKSHVKGCLEKGVVLYLGDLKWITEFRASSSSSHGRSLSYYCPVEHLVVELGRLFFGIGESGGNFWLMGIASFQTYMRCRNGQPSLASVWSLQPLTVPAGSLSLRLLPDSDVQSGFGSKKSANVPSWLVLESGEDKELNCCVDCSAKFECEAEKLRNNDYSTTSSLPSWLKHVKNRPNNNDQECVSVKDLCKKWNSICTSLHRKPESCDTNLTFSSISPSSSTSCFSYDQQNSNPNQAWPIFQPKQTSLDHKFWGFSGPDKTCEPSLRMYIPDPKHGFLSNPSSTPNSASSSDVMEMDYVQRLKEFNAENLKLLCNALENKVPWQKEIIPDIAGTVLQCRSGMLRRKEKLRCDSEAKEETWFFFQGIDAQAKEKIARELAKVVFGSLSNFVSIALSNFSSDPRDDSIEDLRNKRSRDEQSCSYIERFAEAVSINNHRVFFVEDIELADYRSQVGIKRAIEKGKITNSNGDEVSLSDAIIILSCENFRSRSRACSPTTKQKQDSSEEDENGLRSEDTSPCVSLDLNMSFEEDGAEEQSIDDIGLLESVDRCILFKLHEL